MYTNCGHAEWRPLSCGHRSQNYEASRWIDRQQAKLLPHPHVHVVVSGGGVDKRRQQWKKKKGKYLFNKQAIAKVFRARFLEALSEAGFSIPKRVPEKWVADCRRVGKGITALINLRQIRVQILPSYF
jgi:hypothetical protein